jgi:predicted signal transduction protein with EAL and GGDEF domain
LLTDIAGATADALNKSGFPASLLELEITESALAEKPEEALAVLNRLRELGLRLAIDDFGTGYSSLAHLKRFPLDLLKIDQGFIRDIPHSADDMTISSSVIALGHAMGLKVLAEGVETQEQLSSCSKKAVTTFRAISAAGPCRPKTSRACWKRRVRGSRWWLSRPRLRITSAAAARQGLGAGLFFHCSRSCWHWSSEALPSSVSCLSAFIAIAV